MAISSSSLSAALFPMCNSSSISAQPKFSVLSLPSNSAKLQVFNQSRLSTTKVFASPEVLDAQNVSADVEDIPAASTLSVDGDSDKSAEQWKLISACCSSSIRSTEKSTSPCTNSILSFFVCQSAEQWKLASACCSSSMRSTSSSL